MSACDPSALFLVEAEDLLQKVETAVLELESHPDDPELINRLFRAFHTIKGSGAMFGFEAVANFTHHVESALDLVREGHLHITPRLVSLILRAKDHLQTLLKAGSCGQAGDMDCDHGLAEEFAALTAVENAPSPESATGSQPASAGIETTYRIRFRPDPAIFAQGLDPVCLLRDLRALGGCVVACRPDEVPALEQLQPDRCHLSWEITLTSACDEAAIRDVFIFAEDGSELHIERCGPSPAASQASEPGEDAVAAAGLKRTTPTRTAPPASGRANATERQSAVRVPSERLDHLVNLVGELVINQSRLVQAFALSGAPEMAGPVEAMNRLIADLRDSVLGIRMMPIGSTFVRFQRLVRDLSAELGKEIDLVTEGAETELDKTVIDQLGDPLVHLIRNSIDHGIESPEQRTAAGKPRRGTVRLSAAHEGAHVVITIQDDGRGLDRSVIQAKAVERGLLAPDAQLSEHEIFNLIFLPGFSTASAISSVSGRGVGMDVVKRTIEGLRGSITFSSRAGQGTVIRLSLPLTLAIIDGLLVEIEQDRFIIPMAVVMENVELSRAERQRNNGRNVVAVRGELVPYVRLRDIFEIRSREPAIEKIVVVAHEGRRCGLVVDRVKGSHQTVIQPLGRLYCGVEMFSGTTILGDGRVAMILDLPGIIRYAQRISPDCPVGSLSNAQTPLTTQA